MIFFQAVSIIKKVSNPILKTVRVKIKIWNPTNKLLFPYSQTSSVLANKKVNK